jgi:hypothetical protein
MDAWHPTETVRAGKIEIVGTLHRPDIQHSYIETIIIRTKKDDSTQLDTPRVYGNVRRELVDRLMELAAKRGGWEW